LNKIILYHGSEKIITQPTHGVGKAHNDFGLGFYCTESEALAKEWACSSLSGGYANRYSLDLDSLNILALNNSEYNILNWITILIHNRLFRLRNPIANRAKKYLTENFYVDINSYDIITGYRADDSYFDYAEAFLNNAITVEQLSAAMQLGKLGEQIVIKSPYAFSRLTFEGYTLAEQTIYYPLRKTRNEKAETDYLAIASKEEDGLYMADILREKVKANDPRIPRNIFK